MFDARYVVDRLEGETGVLVSQDDGRIVNVPARDLPPQASNGSTVFEQDGVWIVDVEDTHRRAARIREKMRSVFKH